MVGHAMSALLVPPRNSTTTKRYEFHYPLQQPVLTLLARICNICERSPQIVDVRLNNYLSHQ